MQGAIPLNANIEAIEGVLRDGDCSGPPPALTLPGQRQGRRVVSKAGPTRCSMKTIASLVIAMACMEAVQAQTPAQMEYDRQQREYWRAQEQQRQEQMRQQQIMQDNARRQQEESARAMGAGVPQGSGAAGPGARSTGAGAMGSRAGANLEQARQVWLKRPPLPPAQNPLLGLWTRPQTSSRDPFAQLGAMMKGGLCEVLFSGDAVFEFKPDALLGIDKRTHHVEPLDRVEYRGDAKRVVVIPKTTLKLIVFDFEGPDRINWAGQNCRLSRWNATARNANSGR